MKLKEDLEGRRSSESASTSFSSSFCISGSWNLILSDSLLFCLICFLGVKLSSFCSSYTLRKVIGGF